MIIKCSRCEKQYNIDVSRLKGKAVRFNCKYCNKIIAFSPNSTIENTPFVDGAPRALSKTAKEKSKRTQIVDDKRTRVPAYPLEDDDKRTRVPAYPFEDRLKGVEDKTVADITQQYERNAPSVSTSVTQPDMGFSKQSNDEQLPIELPVAALNATRLNKPADDFTMNEDWKHDSAKPSSKRQRKPRRFGLTTKVTLTMLLVSMLPLLILWLLSYQRVQAQTYDDTETLMTTSAEGLCRQIDEWVDKNVRILYTLAKMSEIVSMDPVRQKPLLTLVQEAYPWMYLVFTVDTNGMNVARNDNQPLKSYRDRVYVQGALKGNQLTWQTIISRTNNKPAIVFSTLIRSQNEIVGVMAIAVNLDKISAQIGSWRKGDSGYAFLLDDTYKVVAHQIDEHVKKQEIFDKNPMIMEHRKGHRGLVFFQDEEGDASIGIVAKTDNGWYVALQQKESEAFALLAKERSSAFFLLSSTMFIVSIFAWFSSQTITTPIKKITMAADRISTGDFNVDIDTQQNDEIGDLAVSIVRMKECIRLSLNRLKKRRSSRAG